MERRKYHRTYHLHHSFMQNDDKRIPNLDGFQGEDVVILEKLDGECTTMYPDGFIHARSLDSSHNYTRDWVKRMASILRFDIPAGHRLVFENVNYYHSIEYNDLESFAYLLSIWEGDWRLSYDETREYAELMDLAMPKELYRGPFDESLLTQISDSMDLTVSEGYVITVTRKLHIDDIPGRIAKFVRDGHVQPNADGVDQHWLERTYPNKLSSTKPIKPAFMAQKR